MSSAFSPDLWLPEITIDGDNDTLKIVEDPTGTPTTLTVELTHGTYFLHNDESLHSTRKGLYYAIKNVLNNGTGSDGTLTNSPTNTYGFGAVTPGQSDGVPDAGLKMFDLASVTEFRLDFTSGSTMDARWFGAKNSSGADLDSADDAGAQVYSSDYCVRHRLRTYDLLGGAAVSKKELPRKITERSTDRIADAETTNWGEESDRRFVYEDVWPSMVDPNRAGDTPYATISGLADGDKNNAWYVVWDVLTNGGECIVVHNNTDDLQVDSHDYEIVKLAQDLDDWENFSSVIDDGGDLRRIAFRVALISSSYDH